EPPEPRIQPLRSVPVAEEQAAVADKKPEPEDPANTARRRLESQRKLKQIGIALHNYANKYGRLPAPAIYEGYPGGLLPGAPTGAASSPPGAGSGPGDARG